MAEENKGLWRRKGQPSASKELDSSGVSYILLASFKNTHKVTNTENPHPNQQNNLIIRTPHNTEEEGEDATDLLILNLHISQYPPTEQQQQQQQQQLQHWIQTNNNTNFPMLSCTTPSQMPNEKKPSYQNPTSSKKVKKTTNSREREKKLVSHKRKGKKKRSLERGRWAEDEMCKNGRWKMGWCQLVGLLWA